MIDIPQHLALALEAEDRDRLEHIIVEGNEADFDLLQALVEDDETTPTHRRRAMYALGRWPDRKEAAVNTIAGALPRLNELERITAMDALGRIGTSDAVAAIVRHVGDDDADVRRQVVKSLARVADNTARAELRAMAEKEDTDYVRDLAENELKRLDTE